MTDTPRNYTHAGRKKVDRVCDRCGVVVADTDDHDKFHDQMDALMALLTGTIDEPFNPDPIPVMPRVGGKPFRCSCGANVFTHDKATDRFKCNGCQTVYQGG